MPDPFRKLDQAERKARNIANQPQREIKQAQGQVRRAKRMPGMKARRMKNQAMQPLRQAKGQAHRMQARGRRYKRYGKRRTATDFMVSAMLYPIPFLTLVAGMIDDWDTEFVRYHLVHARMLWVVMIILFPLSPFLWMYSWFLGFRAYSGRRVRIPILTAWAERRGKLDIEPVEENNNF